MVCMSHYYYVQEMLYTKKNPQGLAGGLVVKGHLEGLHCTRSARIHSACQLLGGLTVLNIAVFNATCQPIVFHIIPYRSICV